LPSKPKLGQHYLIDPSVLAHIAETAAPTRQDLLVEIGPGQGALTRHLIEQAQRLVSIELDAGLAAALPGRCGKPEGLEVIHDDFLNVNLVALVQERIAERITVVGNLPYYITSPILRKVIEAREVCARAVFLIQNEVADRIIAGPGSRDYCYLSCIVQVSGTAQKHFVVEPEAFHPAPKVRSAVISVDIYPNAPPAGLLPFLSDCFRAPRKMLRNNLSGRFSAETLAADPDGKMRAQQMTLEELSEMWRRLSKAAASGRAPGTGQS